MKRTLVLLILVIAAFALYWFVFRNKNEDDGPKTPPLSLKKHSDVFNQSIARLMKAYFDMKGAFVEADTAGIKDNCRKFIRLLDSIPLIELKKDTASIYETAKMNVGETKAGAQSLLAQTNITEMRQDFRSVSENLYPSFFISIHYEGPTLYWQNCPMAFGEGKDGNWLSNSQSIANPYLGKKDPQYGSAMVNCGSIKDSIK